MWHIDKLAPFGRSFVFGYQDGGTVVDMKGSGYGLDKEDVVQNTTYPIQILCRG